MASGQCNSKRIKKKYKGGNWEWNLAIYLIYYSWTVDKFKWGTNRTSLYSWIQY